MGCVGVRNTEPPARSAPSALEYAPAEAVGPSGGAEAGLAAAAAAAAAAEAAEAAGAGALPEGLQFSLPSATVVDPSTLEGAVKGTDEDNLEDLMAQMSALSGN